MINIGRTVEVPHSSSFIASTQTQRDLPAFFHLIKRHLSILTPATLEFAPVKAIELRNELRHELCTMCAQAAEMKTLGFELFRNKHAVEGGAWLFHDPDSFDTAVQILLLRIELLSEAIATPITNTISVYAPPTRAIPLYLDKRMNEQSYELIERLSETEFGYYLGTHCQAGEIRWSTGEQVWQSLQIELSGRNFALRMLQTLGITIAPSLAP